MLGELLEDFEVYFFMAPMAIPRLCNSLALLQTEHIMQTRGFKVAILNVVSPISEYNTLRHSLDVVSN